MANPKQIIVFQKPILNFGKKQLLQVPKKFQSQFRRLTMVFTPVAVGEAFNVELRISECHVDDAFVRTEGIKNAFAKEPRFVLKNVTAENYLAIVNAMVQAHNYQLTKKSKIVEELSGPNAEKVATDINNYVENIEKQMKIRAAMAAGDFSQLMPEA